MATIILEPGSTSGELQTAINGAVSGDIIEISSDMDFVSTVTVVAGLAVTVRSGAGNNWVLTSSVANSRNFNVSGGLTLANISLNGGDIGGGITVAGGGLAALEAGAAIQNCRAANGGAVFVAGGALDMHTGSAIRANTATGDGGGILLDGGLFNMYGGVIEQNQTAGSNSFGGGVYVYDSTFNMFAGAVIAGNTITGRTSEGGGVVVDAGLFNMYGGVIEHNQATGANSFGGGVSLLESGFFLFGGDIRDNIAADGGGVSTDDSYFNMSGGFIHGNVAKGGGTVTVIGVGDVGTFGGRGGGVMDNFFSTFEMTGGVIHDNHNEPGINTSGLNGFNGPSKGGGVYVYYGSIFNMGGTAVIADNAADRGGGIAAVGTSVSSNSVTMSANAALTGNNAEYGGGLCFLVGHTSYTTYGGSNSLAMSGSTSIANNSAANGGGVYLYSVNETAPNTGNTLVMSGNASIHNNAAFDSGGGLYMGMVDYGNATNTLELSENTAITHNTASGGHGGGIYAATRSFLIISGPGLIADNRAPHGNGGGVNTTDTAYTNLRTDSETVFSGNAAVRAYMPPADASLLYPNIGFAGTSITDHPLNNYDINFTGGEFLAFQVIYNANGGTGSYIGPEIAPGGADTVLSPQEAGISREGYAFVNWNTEAGGGGVAYAPGDEIILNNNVILFALWETAERPCSCFHKSAKLDCKRKIDNYPDHYVNDSGNMLLSQRIPAINVRVIR